MEKSHTLHIIREIQVKTTVRYHYTGITMASTWNTEHQMLVKIWTSRNSHPFLLEYKMIWPLWKTAWQFLSKRNVSLPSYFSNHIPWYLPKQLKT